MLQSYFLFLFWSWRSSFTFLPLFICWQSFCFFLFLLKIRKLTFNIRLTRYWLFNFLMKIWFLTIFLIIISLSFLGEGYFIFDSWLTFNIPDSFYFLLLKLLNFFVESNQLFLKIMITLTLIMIFFLYWSHGALRSAIGNRILFLSPCC